MNTQALDSTAILVGLRHLERHRRRLAIALAVPAALTLALYFFADSLLRWLAAPLGNLPLHFFSPVEGWYVRIKVAAFAAIGLSMPILLAVAISLLPPMRHRKIVAAAAAGLFWAGVGFSRTLVLPACIGFLIEAGGGFMQPLISGSSYVSFAFFLLLAVGLVFELPIIILAAAHFGLVSSAFLRTRRKAAVLIITILVAVLTPTPDAITLILVACPLVALYEMSVWMVLILERMRRISHDAA